ncbi:hypothetical protein F4808DRAFT_407234 [Astrocystis sublimbata]|nr:hypothetical protein F4808DRAFT_407234 [Astrocystis sublimbata]
MSGEAEKWKSLPQGHLARSTKVPWYHEEFEYKLKPGFRKLLEQWSKVPAGDVVRHIDQARAQAWEVFPWPCIGEFWFIEQGLVRHPDYSQILNRMKCTTPAPTFLDLGTCLGQDVRTLLHDAAPPSNIYGADVLPGFREAGYAFFQDRDRLDEFHFIVGDIFSDVDELAKTRGTWDIIHIAMFLHVFSLADQEIVSRKILKLLKPIRGSTIIGTQTGSIDAGHVKLQPPLCEPGEDKSIYRQSKETLKALFERATESAGINALVWTEYDEEEAKERVAGRKEKGEDWEKRERFFAGNNERRIFFRVDVI